MNGVEGRARSSQNIATLEEIHRSLESHKSLDMR